VSIKRARELRKAMTRNEVRLWLVLRTLKKDGLHFRRQTPLLGYYPDFACLSRRLIVEVDGGVHALPEKEARDRQRDAVLTQAGFRVLRFSNREVDEELERVVQIIKQTAALPHPASFALPPSPQGGGN